MEIQFVQGKDLLKLGFTTSYGSCLAKMTEIRRSTGKKQIHYTDVATFFGIAPDVVLSSINRP